MCSLLPPGFCQESKQCVGDLAKEKGPGKCSYNNAKRYIQGKKSRKVAVQIRASEVRTSLLNSVLES